MCVCVYTRLTNYLCGCGVPMLSVGELTSVTMPTGLVEGLETVLMYGVMTAFPDYLAVCFAIFTVGVLCTVLQRLTWACRVLPELERCAKQTHRK
jgi:hypothetical protein